MSRQHMSPPVTPMDEFYGLEAQAEITLKSLRTHLTSLESEQHRLSADVSRARAAVARLEAFCASYVEPAS